MRLFVSSLFRLTSSRSIAALLICVALLSAAPISEGQSGRRPPKQPTSPDPIPPKQQEPPIQPSTQEDKSGIPVTVTWYQRNIGDSSLYTAIVQDACLDRLAQARGVRATGAPEMNRKQASDIAKRSSGTYVLWFELVEDFTGRSTGPMGSASELYVNFAVFSPGTGKTKTSGHIYQRPRGPGGVPLPVPSPRTPGAAEFSLRYAGREMADRLLSALGVGAPKLALAGSTVAPSLR